ncbi:MAG: MFS transporter [Eggerthellaceae bacterium]|nr:MFS transporter [Eggerthellaceae bacterium]
MPHQRENNAQQPKLWTPVFVGIVVMTLCCFCVGQGLNAGTSVYLAQRGATATLAGIGAAAFSVAAAVGRIVCGPIVDAKGRIIVITIGGVIVLCGTLGAALFTDLDLFVLWRLLQGIGFAAVTTASATAAADVLPIERLGEGIGYYGLGQAIAMSIGPALAIFLVSTEPSENLYRGLSVFAAAVFLISFFCRYEKNVERLPETATYRRLVERRMEAPDEHDGETAQTRKRWLNSVFEPKALSGALPNMVIAPTFGFGIFFTGLFGTTLGVPIAGTFYTVSAVIMIVIRLASRSFMDRTPAFKLHTIAALAGVAFCLTLIAVGQPDIDEGLRNGLFYFAGVPYGLCLGIVAPVNQAVSVKNSPPERWGAANALFFLLLDISIGIAAVLWGVTNDLFGFTTTLVFVMAFIIASIGVARLTYPAADKRWCR